jgi:hypothetical protein
MGTGKMKIGLILTGHPRGYQNCYPSVKAHLLDQHDVDVYISTWNSDNAGRWNGGSNWNNFSSFDTDPLFELYKPVKVHVENLDLFYQNRFPNLVSTRGDNIFADKEWWKTPPADKQALRSWFNERVRDQWYMVKQGLLLIDNIDQYDIIMRLRLDTHLTRCVVKPTNTVVIAKFPGSDIRYHDDAIAYGSPDMMKKYCSFFDKITEIMQNDEVNVEHTPCERMLATYLVDYCGITIDLDSDFSWPRPQ